MAARAAGAKAGGRAAAKIRWDRDLGAQAPGDWAGQIDQVVAQGSRQHPEVAFFHRPSRTLILTDLIANFEPERLSFWQRRRLGMAGALDPDGRTPADIRASFGRGKAALRPAVERMIAWAPERVILAHGRWYDRDAVRELRRAFRWVL